MTSRDRAGHCHDRAADDSGRALADADPANGDRASSMPNTSRSKAKLRSALPV
jgi:hypothetical protein